MKKFLRVSLLITVSFLALVGWFSCCNYQILSVNVSDFIENRTSIRQFKSNISKQMKSNDFFHKDEFINLNGVYGRLSGRRLYNDVVLMKNGYMTGNIHSLGLNPEIIQQKTEIIDDFSKFVEERSGHFIYVQFPRKFDMESKLMPDGYKTIVPKETEELVIAFQEAGIDVIDTLPVLSKTAADIEEYYYRTDHHWKPTAAFKAFQIIMEHLQALYPEQNYDEMITNIDNWTVHEKPEWFLGIHGKRVGEYFTGMDSMYWLTPNFETHVSLYNEKEDKLYADDYVTAFLREDYIQDRGNVLHKSAYLVYIGDDYSLTISRNPNAPSDQKVLIIKDSFSLPLQTFYAMIFRQVDTIDPRHYTATSLKEYVDRTRPDIVIMEIQGYAIINDAYFTLSNDEDILLGDKELLLKKDFKIAAKDNKYSCTTIYKKIEKEKFYTLVIPKITITEGDPDGFTVGLFDIKKNKLISQTVFDIDYCNKYGDCEWTFEAPATGSRDVRLVIYSGIHNQAQNIGVKFENVQLYERSLID